MDIRPGVVQASIALLADEQVGEVHLGTEGSRDPTTYSEPFKGDITRGPSTSALNNGTSRKLYVVGIAPQLH